VRIPWVAGESQDTLYKGKRQWSLLLPVQHWIRDCDQVVPKFTFRSLKAHNFDVLTSGEMVVRMRTDERPRGEDNVQLPASPHHPLNFSHEPHEACH
jgi:hypothetical protein